MSHQKERPVPAPLRFWEYGEEEDRQHRAEEARKLEDARADAAAVWSLAEFYLPADVKEAAERWRMKETLCEMWRAAFVAGWRSRSRFIATDETK